MNRKLLIAVGIILFIGIIALVLFFSRDTQPTEPTGGSSFPVVGEPTTPSGTGISPGFFDDPIDASSRPIEAAPRLVKITDGPVAEGVIAQAVQAAASTTGASVRYAERATGNLYEYQTQNKSIVRLTNQTIPGVMKAHWLSDGSRAYLQYFSTSPSGESGLETYTLPVDGAGQALARNVSAVVPEGSTSVLTMTSNANGSLITRAGVGGVGGNTLFTTDLGRLFLFSTAGGIFIHTPASTHAESYAFSVSKEGLLERIAVPTQGMTFLPSPDGSKALVSSVANGSVGLSFIDLQTGTETQLPLATLTEKCVWATNSLAAYCGVPTASPKGNLPDDWYQGVIGFVDQLWKIDFQDRVVTFAADLPALVEAPIDATSLAVDAGQNTLFFMNRNDGSLWAYEL